MRIIHGIKKGFSLLELMIAITIIAILVAIAVPAYQSYLIKADAAKFFVLADRIKDDYVKAQLQTGMTSLDQFFSQNSQQYQQYGTNAQGQSYLMITTNLAGQVNGDGVLVSNGLVVWGFSKYDNNIQYYYGGRLLPDGTWWWGCSYQGLSPSGACVNMSTFLACVDNGSCPPAS